MCATRWGKQTEWDKRLGQNERVGVRNKKISGWRVNNNG